MLSRRRRDLDVFQANALNTERLFSSSPSQTQDTGRLIAKGPESGGEKVFAPLSRGGGCLQ